MARMDDGFSTTISFADDSSILFFEKEVTPPGIAGGGAIETSTMLNTTWRTMFPKSLITLTEVSLVVAYDPAVYSDILAMMNSNQLITITFPDGSTLAFFGWVDEFTPNANVEGEQPTANVTIQPSNQDTALVETDPIYTTP